MIELIDILGFIVGPLTTLAFLPQAIKIIITKDTSSISIGMYIMQVTGIILWLVYAVILQNYPLLAANGVSLLFSAIILIYKIKYSYLHKVS
ncbi:MAG: SemiSWEET transporter [Pasteurellaceae bacterium]|nr:SemiSWEET transporter [Pasteurellaceae bacterium]